MVSGSLNFLGAAKSRDVKVPDFLSMWGLGIGASSSKALTTGAKAGTIGEYGRLSPNGLSDRPATRSR